MRAMVRPAKRTKIVATIGPASESEEMLRGGLGSALGGEIDLHPRVGGFAVSIATANRGGGNGAEYFQYLQANSIILIFNKKMTRGPRMIAASPTERSHRSGGTEGVGPRGPSRMALHPVGTH